MKRDFTLSLGGHRQAFLTLWRDGLHRWGLYCDRVMLILHLGPLDIGVIY